MLKSTFSGLQFCRYSRLAVGGSQICEIPQNTKEFELIAVQRHPRSSILVAACFPIPPLFDAPLAEERPVIST